jgi:hypothetical protein
MTTPETRIQGDEQVHDGLLGIQAVSSAHVVEDFESSRFLQ